MFSNITKITEALSRDPYNPEINAMLANEYASIGQTATALSFYLRAAEFGNKTHRDLTYSCLLKIGMCLDSQGNRNWNVSNSFLQAIQYMPDRPEAYLMMSKFSEKQGHWAECYTYAELGLAVANNIYGQLPIDVGYTGTVDLIFQKAVASWSVGRQDETRELLLELGKFRNIGEPLKSSILSNYKSLGISLDKIAVILPVRDGGTGRNQRLIKCLNTWSKMTEGLSDIHVILDEDDYHNFSYLFDKKDKIELHIKPSNLSLMEKINSVAVDVAYMYKYVAFIGDDIEFKTPWESKFIDYLKSVPAGLVHGNTLDLPDYIDWGTHPCVTSNLIKALGFFGCPAVEHNFFDNFWNDICKEFDAVKYMPDVIMDHRRLGWAQDELYYKVVSLLESDREKYEEYKRTSFASDLEKVEQLFGGKNPKKVKKNKVVDCFPFFDEFTILDIRFREIGDLVDKFFIVESRETFNGEPKPLYLSDCYRERYPEYADKIEIITPELYPNAIDAWDREYFQKNHICKENLAYLGLEDDDLILMSDADEIPRRKVLQDLIEKGFPSSGGTFEYKTYYYKFNVLTTELCYRSKYCSYGEFTKWKDHRYSDQDKIIDAGWHFSFIKSPQKIKEKIESFSHQEFNIPSINNIDNIEKKISESSDLFNRPEMQMTIVEIDDSFPEYVKENLYDLREWIQPTPTTRQQIFKNVFHKNGSDKGWAHHYDVAYAEVLPENINIMFEIGIFNGASVRSWEILFPEAKIYCADINPEFLINDGNITSFLLDQSSVKDLSNFKEVCSSVKFDVIIDDGSHQFGHSKISFVELFSMLTDNGMYIIEDISKNGNGWQQTVQDWTTLLSNMSHVDYRFIDTNPGVDDDSVVLVIKEKK